MNLEQFEAALQNLSSYLAGVVEFAAAVIIGLAAMHAIAQALVLFFRRNLTHMQELKAQSENEIIRLRLGRWLVLALEFEVAADILRTAVAPTWTQIGQLAAIVILRTVLNYFLQREIDKAAHATSEIASLNDSADT